MIVARIARGLAERGHRVAVYARHRSGLTPIGGTSLGTAWGPSFGRLGGLWLAARALRPLLRADQVIAATWPVAAALPRLGIPYDLLGHGSDITCRPRDPAAFERTWAGARRRLVMSRFLAGKLSRYGLDSALLPAPVPLADAPKPLSAQDPWVMVARATPLKGGERFLALLAASGRPGTLVGDGPERPRWAALARDLGADVRLLGEQSEHTTLQITSRASLCFLLPRAPGDGCGEEGLGLSLIEAAAAGVPAVGCRTGGVPEATGPGLLLEDPDDASASAAEIARWWSPTRGQEAWAWCRARHGIARCVDLLERDAHLAGAATGSLP